MRKHFFTAGVFLVFAMGFSNNAVRAESEPPFFPVVTFLEKISLPAKEQIVKIDLKNPSNARATEYRSTWEGNTTNWLPIANEIHFPFTLASTSIGIHDFSIQFRDSKLHQSAIFKSRFEVLKFEYLQEAIPVAISGEGCVYPKRSAIWYGDGRFERSYLLTLPKSLNYEIRHALCEDTQFNVPEACTNVANRLSSQPWVPFDSSRPITYSEWVEHMGVCRKLTGVAQLRDNFGFESEVFLLPK